MRDNKGKVRSETRTGRERRGGELTFDLSIFILRTVFSFSLSLENIDNATPLDTGILISSIDTVSNYVKVSSKDIVMKSPEKLKEINCG